MNHSRTWIALVALVLAGGAWSARGTPAPASSDTQSQLAPTSPADGADVIGVGERLLRAHLGASLPDAQAAKTALPAHDPLEVFVATLPDPRLSALDWAFDSHLDAIRRACERAGYLLDRFELPWQSKPSDPPVFPGKPGALLFRRDGSLALVYVVAEISTSGIDAPAFAAALSEYAELVPREPRRLRIVGPVFSGSSAALRRALDREHAVLVDIISGSATSESNESVLASAESRTTFRTTLHTDAALLEVLRDQVLPALDLDAGQIAVLQESTTAYGSSLAAKTQSSDFLYLPFPINIGALRDAYYGADAKGGTSDGAAAERAKAKTNLKLGARATTREAPHPTSDLTPPSVDLLLDELTRMLVQRNIRGALIFATDVRDKLFLGSELKRRIPDLQLFTTEGNVLYLRPDLNRWLRGMIVLSTYPLLLRDPAWRPQTANAGQVWFANEGAQGTFNAMLAHLDFAHALADYGDPIRAQAAIRERPPVWVTVVGTGSMLPLAIRSSTQESPVDGRPDAEDARGAFAPLVVSDNTPFVIETPDPSVGGLPRAHGRGLLVVGGVSLVSVLIVALALHGRAGRRARGASSMLGGAPAKDAPWFVRHEHARRIGLAIHEEVYTSYRMLALWTLLLPNVLLLFLVGALELDAFAVPRWLGLAACVLGVLVIVSRSGDAVGIAWKHRAFGFAHLRAGDWPSDSARREWWIENALRAGVFALGVVYVGATIWFCAQIATTARAFASGQSSGERSRFALFVHRVLELDQGASPLVPLMLFGILFALWCDWHLRRIRGLSVREPVEAALDELERDPSVAAGTPFRVRERLFRVIPDAIGLSVFVLIAIGVSWTFFQFERSIEGLALAPRSLSAFDLLLRATMLAPIAASLWAAYRIVSVWRELRELLRRHDSWFGELPFGDIQSNVRSALDVSLLPSRSSSDLDPTLRKRWSALARAADAPQSVRCALDAPSVRDAITRREHDTNRRRADSGLDAVLTAVARAVHDAHRGRNAASDKEPTPAWLADARAVLAAELAAYIESVLAHVRRLSFFLLVSVVITTILCASYPYVPQSLIQTISLLAFGTVVGMLVWLIGSMNRNPTLSTLAGTDAGKVTWDRTLFGNVAAYVFVPLLALITAQYPELRGVLFEWLEPVVKAVAGS